MRLFGVISKDELKALYNRKSYVSRNSFFSQLPKARTLQSREMIHKQLGNFQILRVEILFVNIRKLHIPFDRFFTVWIGFAAPNDC